MGMQPRWKQLVLSFNLAMSRAQESAAFETGISRDKVNTAVVGMLSFHRDKPDWRTNPAFALILNGQP